MNDRLEGSLMAVRQEILSLLTQQMKALDSPLGLTDDQLRGCYMRQSRVQELREQLQEALLLQQESAAPTLVRPGNGTSAEHYIS